MNKFATGTKISTMKTMMDLTKLLRQRGADAVATHEDDDFFTMGFEYNKIPFILRVPMPDPDSTSWRKDKRGYNISDLQKAWNMEVDRRYRAFLLVTKAKLISIEEGISTMEQEFIGNACVNGQTIADVYIPQLEQMALEGKIAPLALTQRGGN